MCWHYLSKSPKWYMCLSALKNNHMYSHHNSLEFCVMKITLLWNPCKWIMWSFLHKNKYGQGFFRSVMSKVTRTFMESYHKWGLHNYSVLQTHDFSSRYIYIHNQYVYNLKPALCTTTTHLMPQILDSSTKCWVYVQSWFRIYIQIYITVPTQNKSLQKYPSDSFFPTLLLNDWFKICFWAGSVWMWDWIR